ncbi:MAG: DNA ligase D [Hyphomicrobiaceae bacterium]|nr:DNA ligase D [Hyphomicrobiaceae bacterium]
MSPGLRDYAARRDFARTPEPRGRPRKKPGPALQFVVQKHAARRLHYDLRLELEGALKSWAVAKGPSLVPGDKRLAIHVEDHPLEYGGFEGNIPAGEYGAGSVIVWDRGTWTPEGDPHKGYAKGHLDFELHGSKLNGRWHLVRMRRRPKERQEGWLLIKSDDDAAREPDDPDVLEERPASVLSGRTLEEVAEEGTDLPPFIEPCLARRADKPPRGAKWVHEIKFDGYRIQARKAGEEVELLTRKGLDWTGRFGSLAGAFEPIAARSAVIDGELVVEETSGASSFAALQAALRNGRFDALRYYAFDLLFRDGRDLRGEKLGERKRQLSEVLAGLPRDSPIRLSEHLETDGATLLKHACRMALEGILSKRIDRPYHSGRGTDWIKTKCVERQEFVVVGYAPSTTARRAVGSLAIADYDGGKLRYRGRVGTGFTEETARDLFDRLEVLRRPAPAPAELPAAERRRGLRWVEPEVVVEVEFRTWTEAGLVRQAVYSGLREDKPASEVTAERATPANTAAIAVREFDEKKLTHPDRLLWPDAGVTKLGLAQFYAEIWPWISPHIVRRPLSLLRCPEGIGQSCFFQKHAWAGIDPSIRRIRPQGEDEDILYIDGLDGLIALVQSGVLEIHPWGSTIDDVERADRMIFDLDPGPGLLWADVIDAAREVADLLRKGGLETFVKTTGGKGLHVVAPLRPAADWESVKAYSQSIAQHMARQAPDRYTASVAMRTRNRRIFVDYLRNSRGATAVAPYSTRARQGAPVSAPLAWEELSAGIGPAHYSLPNLPARLRHLEADPWAGLDRLKQGLPEPIGKGTGIGTGRAPRRPARKTSEHKASKRGT